jgi:nucleotidyltransferase/DNA polymerase involved in DNA repair
MGEISFGEPQGRQAVDAKLLWAFAVDATKPLKVSKSRAKRATKPKYKLHRYLVTACSPRLRERGVRSGMSYDEAKRLVPDMHIFVYNR